MPYNKVAGQQRNYIAAIDASTGIATSWNPNADRPVDTIAVSDNLVYVGGDFNNINELGCFSLASIDAYTGELYFR